MLLGSGASVSGCSTERKVSNSKAVSSAWKDSESVF